MTINESLFVNEVNLKPQNTSELNQMLRVIWNELLSGKIHQFVVSF